MVKLARIDDAIALLPPDSPYRVVLYGFWAKNDKPARKEADKTLRSMSKPYWEPPTQIDEAVALVVLRAIFDVPAPAPESPNERRLGAVPFSLIGSATPAVLALIEERYADADPDLRLDLLTLVASAATEQGARKFADLVASHGWPESSYPRLFSELATNLPHAHSFLPKLLDVRGDDRPTTDLGDLTLRALRSGSLQPASIETTSMVQELPGRIDDLLTRIAQDRGNDAHDDESAAAVHELAMLLDLAGFVGGDLAARRIQRAFDLPETWPVTFALTSAVRRKLDLPAAVVTRVGKDPETRSTLYGLLRDLGASDRIPAEYRSRDAFAEADIVGWLAHPNELGHAPTDIEKMATFTATHEGQEVELYVWRFRCEGEAWQAATSGPYATTGPEGPLSGPSTFSMFEDWDTKTPEEHAMSVLDTLAEWRTGDST